MQKSSDMNADFNEITEYPGQKATQDQLERLFHRYNFARQFARGEAVLEVGCGSGLGLGYLSELAAKVVGGDINQRNVEEAREHYVNNQKVTIDNIEAHKLSYDDGSFSLILCYEAIYYFKQPEIFISEAERVLKDDGRLIICTTNKDWRDFHPSKYSHAYFSAQEIRELLMRNFKQVKLYGAFEVEDAGMKSRTFSLLKRMALKLNLIPGSLRARAALKRVFVGRLYTIPDEVHENMFFYREPVPLNDETPADKYKIIYAIAQKCRGYGESSEQGSIG